MKNYGHFSPDGKEYVITAPGDIPRRWENLMWNKSFYCNAGQDFTVKSFYKHKGGLRSTLSNGSKKYFYIRDRESGAFYRMGTSEASSQVVYGMGYSIYKDVWDGLELSVRLSVPTDLKGEAYTVRVKNIGGAPRKLTVFNYTEVDLAGYPTPFLVKKTKLSFDSARNAIVYHGNDAFCKYPYFNGYLAADVKISSFSTVGEFFLGPKRNKERPAAVIRGQCDNILNQGFVGERLVDNDLTGALQLDVELEPGETREIQLLLAVFQDEAEIHSAISRYLKPGGLDAALCEYQGYLDEVFGKYQINTPDENLNRLFNYWTKHNLLLNALWTRVYSRGFRDVLQDTMGVCSIDASISRQNLLEAMAYVYGSGRCRRAWDAASTALSDEFYTDGPIWIPLAVNEYIKETGDLSVLEVVCPYYDGGEGTVLEHLLAALRFLWSDRGEHNLTLIHEGDWCDSANNIGKAGRGEGVWLNIALYNALIETLELVEYQGNKILADEIRSMATDVYDAVNKNGWDGEWYRFAYDDNGSVVGSYRNEEGRVFLNPQTWAAMSGIAQGERLTQCFKAVDEMLDSEVGPLMLTPPYTKVDRNIGFLTSFHPGYIENGSCYCHAAAFKIVADLKHGRGDRAHDSLMKIIPGGSADQSNTQADCTPYAYTNSRAAMFHPYLGGRAHQFWATGTVSWVWFAFTEHMLGIRRTFEGLRIQPCIHSQWEHYSVIRIFRGCRYEISVNNPNRSQSGIAQIIVNEKPWEGNLLPYEKDGEFKVVVLMK
ncbi:MAG: hypothetical protein HOO88_05890 [Kiritimatiellaceae bacterium]|nr:hypothetical protein [Kiritimatiellaceae bacterium]